MDNRFRQEEADRFIDRYASHFGEDLALRVYTSQLLGREPGLVLHGGGNTSVKSRAVDALGQSVPVLYVKGSGWDLSTIEPEGFPACRIEHLVKLCGLSSLSDDQMVKELRGQMMDPSSPTPSVEALLHAYLPEKFVDHTHSDAILSLVDQPGSAERIRTLYGDDVLFVPYVMPGFVLARKIAELWTAYWSQHGRDPGLMVLDKHGIFTWGPTAESSYGKMIEAVTQAERFLWSGRHQSQPPSAPDRGSDRPTIGEPSPSIMGEIGPIVRGALTARSKNRWVLSWRASPSILSFLDRSDVAEVSQIGCITPDHVIRTKPWPLVIAQLDLSNSAVAQKNIRDALDRFQQKYDAYFEQGCLARGYRPEKLDPLPRLLLLPGVGALGVGKTKRDAEVVLDIFEHTVAVIEATFLGDGYQPVTEIDLFDVEYWSLEQAKLKKAGSSGAFSRHVVVVTGAASGIGLATARAFLNAGAQVALTDIAKDRLDPVVEDLKRGRPDAVIGIPCDVTDAAAVTQLFRQVVVAYGGVDVVVSNAGNAWTGRLADKEADVALERSLSLNLWSHQHVAAAATAIMRRQGTGGALLFNASKSAFNQGPKFGPYAVAKAALVALMRQYAVDYGPDGIRAGAVNADRVRTGLFTPEMLESRAKARGIEVDDYFRANLLGRETTAEDVAGAFVYLAGAEGTTGAVVTVDGGNAAAFPR